MAHTTMTDSPEHLAIILARKAKPMDGHEHGGGDEPAGHDSVPDGLSAAMQDFCDAHDAKDYDAMAAAFHDAFAICDEAPHEEGPHEGAGEPPAEEE